jgi:hypothetical protein
MWLHAHPLPAPFAFLQSLFETLPLFNGFLQEYFIRNAICKE